MYSLDDLLYLMRRLRDPVTGCPWDIEQTFASIVPSTIEEAYEVADAIEREDWPHVKEELGDLLFQVVFYGQLGDEKRQAYEKMAAPNNPYSGFNFHGIVHGLVSKLLHRHPHVFPSGQLYDAHPEAPSSGAGQTETTLAKTEQAKITAPVAMDPERIGQQWEAIKAAERAEKGQQGLLDDVPMGLPALTRALKLQKRAASVGFDWPNLSGALNKIHEEMDELKSEIDHTNDGAVDLVKAQDELGDVLFACVNLARFLKLDPDTCLRGTNQKFYRRFSYVESRLQAQGKSLASASLAEMDAIWDQAKALEVSA